MVDGHTVFQVWVGQFTEETALNALDEFLAFLYPN